MSGQPEKPKRTDEDRRKRREYAVRYRAEHPELVREQERKMRERVKERKRLEARQDPEGFRQRERARGRTRYLRDRAAPGYEERRAKKSEKARLRRQANPATHARILASKKKAIHGVDHEAMWLAFWNTQGGLCYLCGDPLRPGRATAVDHDHTCCPPNSTCKYCRRGLACSRCNRLIGYADDDPDLLRRIADNLEPVLTATRARIATKAQQGTLWPDAR